MTVKEFVSVLETAKEELKIFWLLGSRPCPKIWGESGQVRRPAGVVHGAGSASACSPPLSLTPLLPLSSELGAVERTLFS